MTTMIKAQELEKKWDESINNSSESWWYAGSESKFHFIAIKIPYSSKIYQVNKNEVEIKDINFFDFTKTEDNWVNIKNNNVQFNKANK